MSSPLINTKLGLRSRTESTDSPSSMMVSSEAALPAQFSTHTDGPLKQGGTEMRTRFTDNQKAGIFTGLCSCWR